MRVLFWGTPEFATPALRALLGEGFDVVGVVTQPDKPVGRGRSSVLAPPVKRVATEEGIPVLQPAKPRGDEFIAEVRSLGADISVVVAYGHILPRAVIDLPPRGTLNIHASLLPKLRGAAPIQAAIRDGLDKTGAEHRDGRDRCQSHRSPRLAGGRDFPSRHPLAGQRDNRILNGVPCRPIQGPAVRRQRLNLRWRQPGTPEKISCYVNRASVHGRLVYRACL